LKPKESATETQRHGENPEIGIGGGSKRKGGFKGFKTGY
jgi:hypothetical protein